MHRLCFATILALSGGACGKNEHPPPPSNVNIRQESAPPGSSHSTGGSPATGGDIATADSAAADVYANRCAMCHGADGKGTGPAAASLNPKPRDYTDAAWQASITDEQIAQTIVKGGMAMGKSATMPAQADLASKPEVLAGLVKIVRGFGKHQ